MKTSLVRFVYAVAALAIVSYAYVTLQGPGGLRAWLDKQAAISQLEKSNTRLSRENEQKRDYLHRLDDDPKVQEKVIQEQMKLVHPGDHVFITGPPSK